MIESETIQQVHSETKGVSEKKSNIFTHENERYKVLLWLRKHSISVKIVKKIASEAPKDINELFQNKEGEEKSVVMIITNTNLPASLKRHFKNITNLYNFIVDHIAEEGTITISDDEIRMLIKRENEEPKELKIKVKEQALQCNINTEGLENKILQFTNDELDLIESTYEMMNQQGLPLSQQNAHLVSWRSYLNDNDEELFLEKETNEFEFYPSEEQVQSDHLQNIEKEIEEFQKEFPQMKCIFFYSQPEVKGKQAEPSKGSNFPPLGQNSIFPLGYVPPHLAKKTAKDGLSSVDQLRMQANMTKKEKLKQAKEWLKKGFSTSEIIQRFEMQDRNAKLGYTDPNMQKSMLNHPNNPRIISEPAPSSVPSEQPPIDQAKHDLAVKKMFIGLIRAKTYKNLADCQRHLAREGLQTTLQHLKKLIDEMKEKSAQKKAQQQTQE